MVDLIKKKRIAERDRERRGEKEDLLPTRPHRISRNLLIYLTPTRLKLLDLFVGVVGVGGNTSTKPVIVNWHSALCQNFVWFNLFETPGTQIAQSPGICE